MEPEFDGFEGETSGAAPAGTADGQPQPGTPDGQQPAPATGQQGQQVPEGFIPKYRFDQVSTQVQELRRELIRLQQAQQRPAQPQRQATQAPADPETEAIRQQFFTLFPWAKGLAEALQTNPELLEKLQQTVEVVPQFQQEIGQRWEQQGAAALRTLAAEGKKAFGADLTPEQRAYHEDAFIMFLQRDPDRQFRYTRGDIDNLVNEYWGHFNTLNGDPIRRKAVVTTQQRGERVARIPSSGPGTQALGRGGAKPKTEDDLHELAAIAALSQR